MCSMSDITLTPIPELVAEMAAGRMVILVDDEDRENEGDVVLAAEHVTAEAINFMAKHCRGLICLTLSRELCEKLELKPMVQKNGARNGTAFTVSIEAAQGVHTGISAADRAHTIRVAVHPAAKASDLVQPGHVFPLQAAEGGVLMRAGHTEAGCDLAKMAGCAPASVICEIMKDDGTMARLPDLIEFGKQHGLKVGSIADLIRHRGNHERIVDRTGSRLLKTHWGEFECATYQDHLGGIHLALTVGKWNSSDEVCVRVHEPLSLMDLLDTSSTRHSWPLPAALEALQKQGQGVALLMNCTQETVQELLGAALPAHTQAGDTPTRTIEQSLRTYGVGAQILRDLGVRHMKVMGKSRRMPSMGAYDLEVTGFLMPS